MNIRALAPVRDFIDALDPHIRAHAYGLIDLLEQYGHKLAMPVAKPIGGGLWELRSHTRPAVRILYGFHGDEAILVLALKKQRPALLAREIELARKRFEAYCA